MADKHPEPINMPPQIWGPIFWSTLHIASLSYSDKPTERQKKNIIAFYESLVDVLPCPICRKHYEVNLEEMPLKEAVESRMGLIQWVFEMHNRINAQLGKREISFGEFVESMRNLEKAKRSIPPSHTNTNINKEKRQQNDFGVIDGALLGTGLVLVLGSGLYYIYTEGFRKPK